MAFLEEQFASDGALQELIAVSFVENLWQTGEQFTAIKNALGPSLRGQFGQMYP